jgi:SAM-dependent MidA family methyltransferase
MNAASDDSGMSRSVGSDEPAVRSIGVGIRRVPELDPTAPLPESDPRLLAKVTEEIRNSGPMTFARFMELALYDPEAGYYTRAGDDTHPLARTSGPGRRGDFLTAPESHPIFGWALAGHLESVWAAIDRPARFVVREHGAGTGALAVGILDGLRRSGSTLLGAIRYQATDPAAHRLEALAARLQAAGLAEHLEPVDERPAPGAILANELLDALPVHRVEGGADGDLLERYVLVRQPNDSKSGGDLTPGTPKTVLDTVLGPPSTPALAERLAAEGVGLEPGQPAEICLAIDTWVPDATAPLERGELLVIDYGHPAGDLYRPDRGSLLRAYHRHRVHADPLVGLGRQDLTAHVDLTAVERAAAAAGLQPVGRTRQADFLAAAGAGELLVGLQSRPDTTLDSYLDARSALVRMLDPRATGAFAVLAFGRGLPPGARLRGLGQA